MCLHELDQAACVELELRCHLRVFSSLLSLFGGLPSPNLTRSFSSPYLAPLD